MGNNSPKSLLFICGLGSTQRVLLLITGIAVGQDPVKWGSHAILMKEILFGTARKMIAYYFFLKLR